VDHVERRLPRLPQRRRRQLLLVSPTADRLVSSDGRSLTVRSATDGSGRVQVVANATMPDWSPDGNRVVFARPGATPPAASPGVSRGSIVSVDAASWGGEQVLVASAGEDNYYPSYAPGQRVGRVQPLDAVGFVRRRRRQGDGGVGLGRRADRAGQREPRPPATRGRSGRRCRRATPAAPSTG